SKVQGLTFGWYPTGLVSGHELEGNYLRGTDAYPDMLRPELARMPRIVYEFDSPDTRNGTMYPAMARTFRAVGAQFAAMFAYDMLETASRNMGWQTHYLNLVYTPRKAMSAIIAAEAMHRLPRMRSYGGYPENTRFGDFRISADSNLSELVARDVFMYAGTTQTIPPDPSTLTRIAGYGSSQVVSYGGEGIYFLDKVRPGVWRLEVYPDAVPVRDPFEPMSPDKVVTRAISRAWPMKIFLPDLGRSFTVTPVTTSPSSPSLDASGESFTVKPGVYVLSAAGAVDIATLPAYVGHVGFAEFHAPPLDSLPLSVQSLAPSEYLSGRDAVFRARVVDFWQPDSVKLFLRLAAGDWYHAYPMRPSRGYEVAATVPAAELREGPHQFVIAVFRGDSVITFPEGLHQKPWDWNYYGRESWKLDVVDRSAPLALFSPGEDSRLLAFSRIGDAGRSGLFRLAASAITGKPIFHMELPARGGGPAGDDYTSSLVIADRIRARQGTITDASALHLRLRGLGPHQLLHVTLMEDDGTSWTTAVPVDSTWSEPAIPLTAFSIGRGVLLPEGFPGEWNYWVGPATGRGGHGDHLRLDHLERLQLSLRPEPGVSATPGSYGVEVEWVTLACSSSVVH
ncbi:MAG TPA: hypothetical protein VGP80_07520, partial [Gemmatimonadales bacterium]|nr:hypothetical protein [Gemmatimonadales bacterium]